MVKFGAITLPHVLGVERPTERTVVDRPMPGAELPFVDDIGGMGDSIIVRGRIDSDKVATIEAIKLLCGFTQTLDLEDGTETVPALLKDPVFKEDAHRPNQCEYTLTFLLTPTSTSPPEYNLTQVGGTPQTASDWTLLFLYLQYLDDLVLAATTPTPYNITMTNANQEYSQAIVGTVRKFQLVTRDRTAFRYAFIEGKVAAPTAPYLTSEANEIYYEDHVKMVNPTFYFASSLAGKVMELLVWT